MHNIIPVGKGDYGIRKCVAELPAVAGIGGEYIFFFCMHRQPGKNGQDSD